jgi:hypothetical protein
LKIVNENVDIVREAGVFLPLSFLLKKCLKKGSVYKKAPSGNINHPQVLFKRAYPSSCLVLAPFNLASVE